MITFNGKEVPFGHFPNLESYIPKTFFEHNKEDIRNVVTLKYESDQDLFKLHLVRWAIDFPCTLRITYMPYSRMDRDNGSYLFSLVPVTEFINGMDWDEVIIYEPHSDVTPALLNHCKVVNVTASPIMISKVNILAGTDYQIFYPDAGAFKRYSEVLKTGDGLIGIKLRDFETGRILSLEVFGDKLSDTVVIVDDLCSKGGTFVLAADKLRSMGFRKIILVVAHCEKTIFSGQVFTSGLIDHVVTTDSILNLEDSRLYHGKLHIHPLTEFKYA